MRLLILSWNQMEEIHQLKDLVQDRALEVIEEDYHGTKNVHVAREREEKIQTLFISTIASRKLRPSL